MTRWDDFRDRKIEIIDALIQIRKMQLQSKIIISIIQLRKVILKVKSNIEEWKTAKI